MNTWAEIKKYIKDDESFNPSSLYNPLKTEEENENENKNLLFTGELLSKSNISVINPEPIIGSYQNITGESRWTLLQGKKSERTVSIAYRNRPYLQLPNQKFVSSTVPLLTPIIDDKKDYKAELIQILSNLNIDIEENNIIIRKELASWFEENGKDGVNAIWNLPSEIMSSEDKMSELLISLGRANDYNTIRERLEIFEYYSSSESSDIRYSILLGLSNLGSYRILPIIYKIKKTEKIPVLKQIIESILDKYNRGK